MNNMKKFKGAIPYIILLALSLFLPLALSSRTWINLFVTIVINIVAAVSLRTITLSGNMSFAHGAFIGVGAYTAGVLAVQLGWPMWVTIPVGAVAATLVGLVTGWPFARLKSIYFCMGTMFMGQAIVMLISTLKVAGGAIGLTGIPSMSTALASLANATGLTKPQVCYFFILAVAVVSCAVMYRFEHSRVGVTLRALAQSENVAASIGVNPTFYRLLAMGIGSFFAGLIGACGTHYSTTLSPNGYTMNLTLWIIMYLMVGGKRSFLGPIVGALVVSFIQNIANLLVGMSGVKDSGAFVAFARWIGNNAAYTPFLTAGILLLVAYLLPGGLVGLPDAFKKRGAGNLKEKARKGGGN